MPALTVTPAQWLELQKVRLMARFAFYGILLSYLALRPDPDVPIAATGRMVLGLIPTVVANSPILIFIIPKRPYEPLAGSDLPLAEYSRSLDLP